MFVRHDGAHGDAERSVEPGYHAEHALGETGPTTRRGNLHYTIS